MAAKFTAQLSDVNASFSPQPVGPVDTTAADAISAIGNVGLQAHAAYRVNRMEEDMGQLESEFMDQDVSYTAEEMASITDFGKRMDKLSQMAKTAGRVGEFKTRAEALLKQHINQMPGLERELRQSASSMLGFDPTGSAMQQKMQEIEQAQFDSRKMMENIDRDAQSFGMIPGEVYTKDGQQRYLTYVELRRVQQEAKMLQDTAQAMKGEDVEVDIQRQLMQRAGDLQTSSRLGAEQVMGTLATEMGIQVPSTAGGLSPEMVAQMQQGGNANAAIAALEAQKNAVMLEYMPSRGDFGSESEWNLFIDTVLKPYDDMIGVLNGTQTIENVNRQKELAIAARSQNMLNDPNYVDMVTWSEATGIAPPAAIQAQVGQSFFRNWAGVYNGSPDVIVTPTQAQSITKEETRAVGQHLMEAIDNSFNGENATPESKDAASMALYKMAEMFNTGEKYQKAAVDEFVRVLNDPNNIANIQQVMEYDPTVRDAIEGALVQHSRKTARTASAEIDRAMQETFKASAITMSEIKDAQIATPVFKNGQFTVVVNDAAIDDILSSRMGLMGVDPKQIAKDKAKLKRRINDITRRVIRPMNDTVNAWYNLTGLSKDDVAYSLFSPTSMSSVVEGLAPEGASPK